MSASNFPKKQGISKQENAIVFMEPQEPLKFEMQRLEGRPALVEALNTDDLENNREVEVFV